MKFIKLIVVFAIFGGLVAQAELSVQKMVKAHPELQKVCDKAGGCQNVTITCEKFDNTGNSILRGETIWTIKALGTEGEGFQKLSSDPIAAAVRDWFDSRRVEADLAREGKEHPTVYPHSKPCDEKCK